MEGTEGGTEETGISTEEKVDSLIAIAHAVKKQLKVRTIAFVVVGSIFAALLIFDALVIQGLRHQADRLEDVAFANNQIGNDVKNTLGLVQAATGDEAKAQSAAATTAAINELRRSFGRSVDCAKLEDEGDFPACVEVNKRLDAIRAGLDPFLVP